MKREGFTLIEMLVVIAVIALLMAIALPSLKKARRQGYNVLCRNNLREIHRVTEIYAENNQSYPYGFLTGQPNKIGDSSKDWRLGLWWFQFLEDFHNDEKNPTDIRQLWCPANQNRDPKIAGNVLCNNYGINYSICKITLGSDTEFTGEPLRPTQIKRPASTVIAMDSGYTLASWKMFAPDTAIYPFEAEKRQDSFYAPGWENNDERLINESLHEDALRGRHDSRKINAVFLDGRIEHKPPEAFEPAFDNQGIVTTKSCWAP